MDYLHPWTKRRRDQYRLPDGRWNGLALAPVIARMREQGRTMTQIAEITGIPHIAIRNSSKHADTTPKRGVIITALASDLGVTASAIRQYVHAHGIPFVRYGVKITVDQATADRITEHYQTQLTSNQVGPGRDWVLIADLARMFGTTAENMRVRLENAPYNTIRSHKVKGVVGNQHGYNVHDARLILSTRPIALDAPPQGTLPSPAIARLLDLSLEAMQNYARQGAPHHRVRQGRNTLLYYRPQELSAWLMGRKHPVPRSIGRTLAALTSAERAA